MKIFCEDWFNEVNQLAYSILLLFLFGRGVEYIVLSKAVLFAFESPNRQSEVTYQELLFRKVKQEPQLLTIGSNEVAHSDFSELNDHRCRESLESRDHYRL